MSFDEFLSRRLAELLRFANVLCDGDTQRAERLVADVLVRAFPHWYLVHGAGRPFAVLRAAVVRLALESASSTAQRDELRIRAIAALAVYSGQTLAETAAVLDVAIGAVESDLASARGSLGTEDSSIADRMDDLADTAPVEPDRIASTILDRLESETEPATDARSFAALILLDTTSAPASSPNPQFLPGVAEPDPEPAREPASSVDSDGRHAPAQESAPGSVAGRDPAHTMRRVASAVVIVVAAVAVTVLVSSRDTRPDARGSAVSVPLPSSAETSSATTTPPGSTSASAGGLTSPIVHPLPGTRILGQYYGSGGRTITRAVPVLAQGRELAATVVCSGPGGASVGPIRVQRCDGTPVGANLTAEQVRSVRVVSDRTTTWRLALVDEPEHGTNGSLSYPQSALLDSTAQQNLAGSGSGTGPGVVALSSGATSSRVQDLRLILTCRGSGVSFGGAGGFFDGEYTKTCFAGWSYEFDVVGAALPGRLSVRAAAGTSWRLVVIRG